MKFFWDMMGKIASKKLGLKDGSMEDKKKWYQSKNVWTGVCVVLFGAYEAVEKNLAPQFGWTLPQVPPIVYTILGAMGIYTRVSADKNIG